MVPDFCYVYYYTPCGVGCCTGALTSLACPCTSYNFLMPMNSPQQHNPTNKNTHHSLFFNRPRMYTHHTRFSMNLRSRYPIHSSRRSICHCDTVHPRTILRKPPVQSIPLSLLPSRGRQRIHRTSRCGRCSSRRRSHHRRC